MRPWRIRNRATLVSHWGVSGARASNLLHDCARLRPARRGRRAGRGGRGRRGRAGTRPERWSGEGAPPRRGRAAGRRWPGLRGPCGPCRCRRSADRTWCPSINMEASDTSMRAAWPSSPDSSGPNQSWSLAEPHQSSGTSVRRNREVGGGFEVVPLGRTSLSTSPRWGGGGAWPRQTLTATPSAFRSALVPRRASRRP